VLSFPIYIHNAEYGSIVQLTGLCGLYQVGEPRKLSVNQFQGESLEPSSTVDRYMHFCSVSGVLIPLSKELDDWCLDEKEKFDNDCNQFSNDCNQFVKAKAAQRYHLWLVETLLAHNTT
jgi:hypothetical protein